MPSKDYGAVITVYPASISSASMPPTPVTLRTPLLERSTDYDDVQLTEDEQREYDRDLLTWETARDWRFWIRREWMPLYFAGVVLLAAVSFVAIYHREIIERLKPIVEDVREVPFGWVVPIAGITICSFPPLFGSEIIMILSGVVWGVKRGCAIAAAGTVMGEMACFTMFSTCCRKRADRFSRQSLNYSSLSRVVAHGGLFVAWVVRLSLIPTHVSTVIFAVCGLDYGRFLGALILSLPKQFTAVYIGRMVTSNPSGDDIVVSHVVLGSTILITFGAFYYIYVQTMRVRKRVFLDMREDLLRRGGALASDDDDDSDFLVWTGSRFRRRSE